MECLELMKWNDALVEQHNEEWMHCYRKLEVLAINNTPLDVIVSDKLTVGKHRCSNCFTPIRTHGENYCVECGVKLSWEKVVI